MAGTNVPKPESLQQIVTRTEQARNRAVTAETTSEQVRTDVLAEKPRVVTEGDTQIGRVQQAGTIAVATITPLVAQTLAHRIAAANSEQNAANDAADALAARVDAEGARDASMAASASALAAVAWVDEVPTKGTLPAAVGKNNQVWLVRVDESRSGERNVEYRSNEAAWTYLRGGLLDATERGSTLATLAGGAVVEPLKAHAAAALALIDVPAGVQINTPRGLAAVVQTGKWGAAGQGYAWFALAGGRKAVTMDAHRRDSVSVTSFGAVGDGAADDWAACQRAIRYALQSGVPEVFFPEGDYRITRPLAVWQWDVPSGNFAVVTLRLKGAGNFVAPHKSTILPTFDDCFTIGVCGSRDFECRSLDVQGKTFGTQPLLDLQSPGFGDGSAWTGVYGRFNRYSPQAAICVDPFSGGLAPAVADRYAGYQDDEGNDYAAFYATAVQRVRASARPHVKQCSFRGHVVATMFTPNGATQLCDQAVVEDCQYEGVRVVYATGDSQHRGAVLRDPYGGYVDTVIDTLSFGQGTGSAPRLDGGTFGGGIRRLFNVGTTYGSPVIAHGTYAELIVSLGTIMTGQRTGASLSSLTLFIYEAVGTSQPHLDCHGAAGAEIRFRSCNFNPGDGRVTRRIWGGAGGCVFEGGSMGASPPVLTYPGERRAPEFRDCAPFLNVPAEPGDGRVVAYQLRGSYIARGTASRSVTAGATRAYDTTWVSKPFALPGALVVTPGTALNQGGGAVLSGLTAAGGATLASVVVARSEDDGDVLRLVGYNGELDSGAYVGRVSAVDVANNIVTLSSVAASAAGATGSLVVQRHAQWAERMLVEADGTNIVTRRMSVNGPGVYYGAGSTTTLGQIVSVSGNSVTLDRVVPAGLHVMDPAQVVRDYNPLPAAGGPATASYTTRDYWDTVFRVGEFVPYREPIAESDGLVVGDVCTRAGKGFESSYESAGVAYPDGNWSARWRKVKRPFA